MDYFVIDRFENAVAVCESSDGRHFQLDSHLLPNGAKEGSVIRLVNGAYQLDKEMEEALRRANWKLQKQVFGRE